MARFAREFDMELYKTTDADVACKRDFTVFHADNGPWSVKVLVSKALDD